MTRKMGVRVGGRVVCLASAICAALAFEACDHASNLGGDVSVAGGGGDESSAGRPDTAGGSSAGAEAGGGPLGGGGSDAVAGAGGSLGGEGGTDATVPYPLNPTTPVPAACGCASDEVCNAEHQCVPRCEPGGVCAIWRIERNAQSLLANGDTLYFVLAPALDELGNPLPGDAGKESLWKAHYPELAPVRVALLNGLQNRITSHGGSKTYLERRPEALAAVDDDGSITEHALPKDAQNMDAQDVVVGEQDAYSLQLDGSIQRLPLGAQGTVDGDSFTPFITAPPKVPRDYTELFAADRLWRLWGSQLCSFDPASPETSDHCVTTDATHIYAAQGARAITNQFDRNVQRVDVDQQSTTLLAMSDGWLSGALGDGFMVGWFTDRDDPKRDMLGRFPTAGLPTDPTPLLSTDVVSAFVSQERFADMTGPAIAGDAVYWTPFLVDNTGSGTPRYIFRLPLAK